MNKRHVQYVNSYSIILAPTSTWTLLSILDTKFFFESFSETNSLPSQGRGKVGSHTTLPGPHLWNYKGYAVFVANKNFQRKIIFLTLLSTFNKYFNTSLVTNDKIIHLIVHPNQSVQTKATKGLEKDFGKRLKQAKTTYKGQI